MAKLTSAKRNAMAPSKFAGPDRSYPIPDRAHAANAKARASQMEAAGKLSPAGKAKIDAKANKVLDQGDKRDTHHKDHQHPRSHDEFERLGHK